MLSAIERKANKKESDRKYYLEHRERLIERATKRNQTYRDYHREYNRRWHLKYPHKKREAYLKRAYKVSIKEYEELKLIQGGLCAICLKPHERLVIDHCHESKKLRGLLCTTCNAGLGQFKDNTGLLREAVKYLERHETS